jgi:hypothetical protein
MKTLWTIQVTPKKRPYSNFKINLGAEGKSFSIGRETQQKLSAYKFITR